MATYSAIITAIDDAIEGWVGKPVSLSTSSGESVTYRSLNELIDARKYYAALAARAANKKPFKIQHLKSPAAG